MRTGLIWLMVCYGFYLNVPPKPHELIDGVCQNLLDPGCVIIELGMGGSKLVH